MQPQFQAYRQGGPNFKNKLISIIFLINKKFFGLIETQATGRVVKFSLKMLNSEVKEKNSKNKQAAENIYVRLLMKKRILIINKVTYF